MYYTYNDGEYEICIGSNNTQEPRLNDKVSIQQSVCSIDNSCNFSYGKLLYEPSSR